MNTQYLMKSTSGIRGIIGVGINPVMITEYAAAFASMLNTKKRNGVLVVGRDSRPSGVAYARAVIAGAMSVGADVVDIGIAPTPTVAMAVIGLKAMGGICLTASHNPGEWNALKFFNSKGEFIDQKNFDSLELAVSQKSYVYSDHMKFGVMREDYSWVEKHIDATLKAPAINVATVRKRKFS